jgi:hypothetical protein
MFRNTGTGTGTGMSVFSVLSLFVFSPTLHFRHDIFVWHVTTLLPCLHEKRSDLCVSGQTVVQGFEKETLTQVTSLHKVVSESGICLLLF